MAEPKEPLSKRLEVPARWAILGGVIVAAVGLMLGCLPLVAGAFLLNAVAAIVPTEIALRECRRDQARCPPCGATPESIAACLRGEGIGPEPGDRRFQELVSRLPLSAGRGVH